jgi:dTDP-4-dehydrorhamnose reductase
VKVLVIGADHRLGLEIVASLQGRDVPFVSISSHDPVLMDARALAAAVAAHGTGYLVNALSADCFLSDDGAQHRRGLLLIKNLAHACRAHHAMLLHVSDASMFAGRRSGAYREKDKPDNADARAKRVLKGESHVLRRVPRHIVLRGGPLIAATGDNLFTRVMQRLERGELLECTDDRLCPTPAADLARVIVAVLLQIDCGATPWGIYHYCGADPASLYNFAEAVVALASQYGRIRRDAVQLRARAPDDRNLVLNCHQILGTFGIKQRPWRSALPAVVAEYCR